MTQRLVVLPGYRELATKSMVMTHLWVAWAQRQHAHVRGADQLELREPPLHALLKVRGRLHDRTRRRKEAVLPEVHQAGPGSGNQRTRAAASQPWADVTADRGRLVEQALGCKVNGTECQLYRSFLLCCKSPAVRRRAHCADLPQHKHALDSLLLAVPARSHLPTDRAREQAHYPP